MSIFLTFDIGTTSVKTALIDERGYPHARASVEYDLSVPLSDHCEVDAEVYWNAFVLGLNKCMTKSSSVFKHDIKGIIGCSQGETFIVLDQNEKLLRPAIVWLDRRAVDEAAELDSGYTAELFRTETGLPAMTPMWSAPKLLWLAHHEKSLFDKIKTVLWVGDWIEFRLTGRLTTTASLNCTSALVDVRTGKYRESLVNYIGLGGRLPVLVETGSVVGNLTNKVAKTLGLPAGVTVYKGSMDQNMGAVGAGNVCEGIVTETTGTALVVGVVANDLSKLSTHGIPFQPHAIRRKYIALPFSETAGILYKKFRDVFSGSEIERLGPDEAFAEMDRLAANVEPGSEGLILLPYFAGAAFPVNNSQARGVLYGLNLGHGKGHFVRAIMEGVSYALRDILEGLNNTIAPVKEVRSMGGGARSPLWLSIKANVTGLPFRTLCNEETASLGCALIAANETGDYRSVEEAATCMVKTSSHYEPSYKYREIYDNSFGLYKKLRTDLFKGVI